MKTPVTSLPKVLFYNGKTSDALIIYDQALAAAKLDGEEIKAFGFTYSVHEYVG